MGKKILFVMPVMKGGGAERVASLLTNELYDRGYQTQFLLTSTKADDVKKTDIKEEIPLLLLQEQLPEMSKLSKLKLKILKSYSSLFSRIYEAFDKSVPAHFAYYSFVSQYKREIDALREIIKKDPSMTVISFLQPSIPIVILASRGLPNKIIISERGNPKRLMEKRYGRKFIEKYYKNINKAVFQTDEAKSVYPKSVSEKGVVIFNPIKDDLPRPYFGKRNKYITTFCRISKQKNLPVMIEAFSKVHAEHPEFILRIVGDAPNREDKQELELVKEQINKLRIVDSVKFEPFMENVHEAIIKDAMYVSSSDYEGISNAMLEAMAIGMPVVCTDCPIGGAKATITDGENGLLVPIKNPDELYKAIKRVIEEDGLAERLSQNAAKLREKLSLDKITDKWEQLIN